jgi:hypothetical protein
MAASSSSTAHFKTVIDQLLRVAQATQSAKASGSAPVSAQTKSNSGSVFKRPRPYPSKPGPESGKEQNLRPESSKARHHSHHSRHYQVKTKINAEAVAKKSAPNGKSAAAPSSATGGSAVKINDVAVLEDCPSSAVELHVKEKYLKKLNRQERVVEEVKLVLKPYYQRREVNKDDYKEIMRKSVPKICHSKTGEINPVKIKLLVESYIKKAKHAHKKEKNPHPKERS